MQLGEALRLVRVFHDKNQTDVAAELDISRSYLSEIESGKKTPSFELLQRYATSFKLPLSSLLLFTENAGESPRDLSVKSMLGSKAISILKWIEDRKAA